MICWRLDSILYYHPPHPKPHPISYFALAASRDCWCPECSILNNGGRAQYKLFLKGQSTSNINFSLKRGQQPAAHKSKSWMHHPMHFGLCPLPADDLAWPSSILHGKLSKSKKLRYHNGFVVTTLWLLHYLRKKISMWDLVWLENAGCTHTRMGECQCDITVTPVQAAHIVSRGSCAMDYI